MNSTLRRTWAEINLDHLTHNFETIRRQVGPNAKLLGVVKADAYGHGAVRVAKHLEKIGAAYLAVSNIDEAEELRLGGIKLPILMLGYTPEDQAERIINIDMTQAVQNYEIAKAFSDSAVRLGKKMKVHVKLDTGMGRLGFQCDDAHFEESLHSILAVLKLPGLDIEGVFTHFCVSDEEAPEHVEFTKVQHERFVRMIEAVETQGNFRFRLHHCCNAGGIASYPEWAWDMVRCGIILYGTGDLAEKMGMKPVMTVKTVVSTIKNFTPETSVSYGRKFYTERPSRIAVLPIGYADGLMRALSGKMQVLTPYGTAPQVGRICMDMCMIDITDLPDVKVGDDIEVFGENILCETDAKLCGTISYELLCAVSKRVPRLYFLGGRQVDYNLQLLY
ncbi:MAG: alanine racemase [Eubacteriales bacterium]|nr:alanine racemase [Eubacteriales bacterium]